MDDLLFSRKVWIFTFDMTGKKKPLVVWLPLAVSCCLAASGCLAASIELKLTLSVDNTI